jgi:RecB family exonuclease
VISGRENEGSSLNSPAGSPLGWLTDIFGGQPLGGKRGLIGPVKVKLRTLRRDGGQLKSADRVVALTIPVIRNDGSRPSAPRVVAQGREVRRRRILTGPLTDEWGGDTYSATQIRTYLHCPALYYFRYVLGLRPSPSATAGALQADRSDDRADAGIEGDLTHAMLSGIFANDVAPESIRGRISAMMRYPGEGEDPGSLASRVFANVTSFTGSEEGRAILNSSEAKTEFPISTILERSVVSGIVDRLYRGEGGLWEIVDYKTDEIPVSGIASKALIYKPQVAVYALMVHRVFRQSPVRAKVLFLKERCQAVDFIFGDEELSTVREQILDVIRGIRKGLFPGRDLPCEGCPDSRGVVCGKGAGKPAP